MTRTTGNPGDGKDRAVLLEISGPYGIGLTPDGRFLRVPCAPWDREGQEVSLHRRAVRARPRVRPRPAAAWAAAALIALVVLSPLVVGRVLASGNPVAFVSVDINPSLEFGVNRWERAVTARGLDADGTALLARLSWRGRPIDELLADVGSAAVTEGFVDPGPAQVVLAAVPAGSTGIVPPGLGKRLEKAREALGRKLKAGGPGGQGSDVTVETVTADAAELRDQAATLGLSVGQYAVLLTAQEEGLAIGPKDIAQGVGQAIVRAGGRPAEVLKEAHNLREMSKLAKKFSKRNGLEPAGEDAGDRSGAGDGGGLQVGGGTRPGETGREGQGGRGRNAGPKDKSDKDGNDNKDGKDKAGPAPSGYGGAGSSGGGDDLNPSPGSGGGSPAREEPSSGVPSGPDDRGRHGQGTTDRESGDDGEGQGSDGESGR